MRGALDAYAALDRLPDALPHAALSRACPAMCPSRRRQSIRRLCPDHGNHRRTQADRSPESAIAVKDCMCVAGVPMMNGSSTFEGYVPEIDATVVTRILDAGGTIVGKAANEDYCYSGGSHTNARYPVDNPHRPGFTAGGSSSGSGSAGRRRRGRHGDRHRSGRLDPHTGIVLRRGRHEGDIRTGPLHRQSRHGIFARSCRADHADGRRQCASSRSHRRTRRARQPSRQWQLQGRSLHRRSRNLVQRDCGSAF